MRPEQPQDHGNNKSIHVLESRDSKYSSKNSFIQMGLRFTHLAVIKDKNNGTKTIRDQLKMTSFLKTWLEML